MMMVIGSAALHSASFRERKYAYRGQTLYTELSYEVIKDIDLVGTIEEIQEWANKCNPKIYYPISGGNKIVTSHPDGKPVEAELAWSGSTAEYLMDLVEDDPRTTVINAYGFGVMCPSVDVLYMIKMSHRFLKNSPHFLKTMRDIQRLRKHGAVLPSEPGYLDWYNKRKAETYNYTHPNLNQTKKGFFNPHELLYTYDHDSIHEAVKQGVKPAYTYFQKPGSEVAVSRKRWRGLNRDIRINSVLEESYVLALERSQVPHRGKVSPDKSFTMALEKVCTSITSGWWRDFAWEHYEPVLARYNPNYVIRFWKAVDEGKVKPFEANVSEDVQSEVRD